MKYAAIIHPDFSRHIVSGTRIHRAAGGFRFLEGPVWDMENKRLIFSDIKANALFSYTREHGISMFRENSYLANGNVLDAEGSLLTCEHGTSRISKTTSDGRYSVLVDAYKGKQLNSPNDLVIKSDGTIYFTDPAAGRSAGFGIPRKQELDFQGVFRFDPASDELTLLSDDFSFPNGLCFSPDEKYLYVNDTQKQHIRCFEIDDKGLFTDGGKVFTDVIQDMPVGKVDGMKFDSTGLLFCTGPGGIQIFNQEAVCVGRIYVPEQAANFAWGGLDKQTLFITASSTLYTIRMEKPGL